MITRVNLLLSTMLLTTPAPAPSTKKRRSRYSLTFKLFVAEQYMTRKNGTKSYAALRGEILREAREKLPGESHDAADPARQVIDSWVREVDTLRSSVQQPTIHSGIRKKVPHGRPRMSAATKRQWQKKHLLRDGTALLEGYKVHLLQTLEWIHRHLKAKAVITRNFE
eukprot:3939524-Rhodomonas_salina.1